MNDNRESRIEFLASYYSEKYPNQPLDTLWTECAYNDLSAATQKTIDFPTFQNRILENL